MRYRRGHLTTFKFRLPEELLEKAKAKAKREDLSVAQVIRRCLRQWVEDDPSAEEEEKATEQK